MAVIFDPTLQHYVDIRHLIRMSPGHLSGKVFRARPTGGRPREDPGHTRGVWEHLRILLENLDEVAGEREVWAFLLRLLSPSLDKK